jgi:hypothetical protein
VTISGAPLMELPPRSSIHRPPRSAARTR